MRWCPGGGEVIRAKRAYEAPSSEDGRRVLIDRLWPRGVTKAAARIDRWEVDLAPSAELRKWFGHDPTKYARFRQRYRMELLRHQETLVRLALEAERGPVTLVYAAKDPEHSNASVLLELLDEILRAGLPGPGKTGPRGRRGIVRKPVRSETSSDGEMRPQ